MKSIISFLICLQSLGFTILAVLAYKTKEQYDNTEHFRDIIVKIYSQNLEYNWLEPYKNDSSHESIGTGFFISKDLILTASHVIEDSIRVDVTLPSKFVEP